MDPIFIIGNPNAGRGQTRRWIARARDLCRQTGITHEIQETAHRGHAYELAKQAVADGWPIVAVFGGDGTVHEVVNVLAGTETALVVFPCGTCNDFARSLGIPRRFQLAFGALHQGTLTSIDLGRTNQHYFANMLGIGFSVDVVERANALRLGGASFLVAAYQLLRVLPTYQLEVQIEDETLKLETLSFHINNNPYSGGGMAFAPEADPSDGWLDVGWVKNIGAWQFARTFPRMYHSKGVHHPVFPRRRAKRIDIRTEHPLPAMCDGELTGHTPLQVRVVPRSLRVLLP